MRSSVSIQTAACARSSALRADFVRVIAARRVLSADLRGSSWPVVVETGDGVRFTKLRGAGQGVGALVAEMIVGSLAEAIGLRVPERVLIAIEPGIESENRRDELRDLLDRSAGINLGFAYLDGAKMFEPDDVARVSTDDAAAILWLDSLVMNPDRTPRNPNIMWWRDRLWLIDHGASLSFQYSWSDVTEDAPLRPFTPGSPHALQSRVSDLDAWDEMLANRFTRETLADAVADVPDDFLGENAERRRAAYVAFLWKRLKAPRHFYQAWSAITTDVPRVRPTWLRKQR
jgi:hypothetical protein